MKDFKDKVAVITGAGSGIGLALAVQCAQEGMKVVLADIDQKFLRRAKRKLEKIGAIYHAVLTDVSKSADIKALAKETLDKFGEIHLLINNAGVGHSKYTWNYTLKDWEWQLGVCFFGVAHGVRIFTPIMLKQDTECHIVNVSSIEGLLPGSGPGGAIYGAAKHGIVSLSETLKRELEIIGSKLKISVVCPGAVITRIWYGDIHRPEELQNAPTEEIEDSRNEDLFANVDADLDESPPISAEQSAIIIMQGIKDEKFYILTHKDQLLKGLVKERFDNILKAFDN
ncbi:MAG: SDR family NAD(P)-dependent oxidoreductase [Promethearchaeota archaeon]